MEEKQKRTGNLIPTEWINVDDDLPEYGEYVFLCGFNYSGEKHIEIGTFDRSTGWQEKGDVHHVYFWSRFDIKFPDFEPKEEHCLCNYNGPIGSLHGPIDTLESRVSRLEELEKEVDNKEE